MIGNQAELSDDGQFALIEFAARTRADLASIIPARDARAQVSRKADARREDIIREFQKLKRKFNLDTFGMSVR